jgi:hypothetical protein
VNGESGEMNEKSQNNKQTRIVTWGRPSRILIRIAEALPFHGKIGAFEVVHVFSIINTYSLDNDDEDS